MTTSTYHGDIIAWASEQARLLRTGQFSKLDIERVAEEIEDVGKSERRELENRMAALLAHPLQRECQPSRRGNSNETAGGLELRQWDVYYGTIAAQETKMPLSVRLTPEENALLEAASRQTALSKSQLARQAIQEFCNRLRREERSAFDLGADLFGQGSLSAAERDGAKAALGEKLRAKHRRLD
jgi:hypothetical protein